MAVKVREHADFSQYNADVDVSAPGVGILSTSIPGSASIALIAGTGNLLISGKAMINSSPINAILQGELVACPNFGQEPCPGRKSGPHLCLIERYGLSMLLRIYAIVCLT